MDGVAHVGLEAGEVEAVTEARGERGRRPLGVVPGPVEPLVHPALDAEPERARSLDGAEPGLTGPGAAPLSASEDAGSSDAVSSDAASSEGTAVNATAVDATAVDAVAAGAESPRAVAVGVRAAALGPVSAGLVSAGSAGPEGSVPVLWGSALSVSTVVGSSDAPSGSAASRDLLSPVSTEVPPAGAAATSGSTDAVAAGCRVPVLPFLPLRPRPARPP